MCRLFTYLGILVSSSPMLLCDILGATYLTTNLVFHVRMKHVEIDYQFVHNMVSWKELQVQFISCDQLIDILTKSLSCFSCVGFKMNLVSSPYSTYRGIVRTIN
jgi:hypothetical protein